MPNIQSTTIVFDDCPRAFIGLLSGYEGRPFELYSKDGLKLLIEPTIFLAGDYWNIYCDHKQFGCGAPQHLLFNFANNVYLAPQLIFEKHNKGKGMAYYSMMNNSHEETPQATIDRYTKSDLLSVTLLMHGQSLVTFDMSKPCDLYETPGEGAELWYILMQQLRYAKILFHFDRTAYPAPKIAGHIEGGVYQLPSPEFFEF